MHQQSTLSNFSNTSVVICSQEDHDRYLKDVNDRNRIDRIKQVRDQEKDAAHLLRDQHQQKLIKEKEKLEEESKYKNYLWMKDEIQNLKALREIELEKAGKAMRDAQDAEEQSLRDDLVKKTKAIHDESAKRSRGKHALERERQLQQEKIDIEEAITQIERKKQVLT